MGGENIWKIVWLSPQGTPEDDLIHSSLYKKIIVFMICDFSLDKKTADYVCVFEVYQNNNNNNKKIKETLQIGRYAEILKLFLRWIDVGDGSVEGPIASYEVCMCPTGYKFSINYKSILGVYSSRDSLERRGPTSLETKQPLY
ncbi:hypothetical protein ACJX0J_029492, partial [Zea mays]